MKNSPSYLFTLFDIPALEVIRDIRFTLREIEIISCLLSGRNFKTIGRFLSIAEKTVESHSRNIMNKIGCNSKEGIISFIEESDKFFLIKQFYQQVGEFEKKLEKIALCTTHAIEANFKFSYPSKSKNIYSFFDRIKKNFSKLGLNINYTEEDADHLQKNIILIYLLLPTHQKTSAQISNFYKKHQQVIFLNMSNKEELDYLSADQYINLNKNQNYYCCFFKLLQKVFPHLSDKIDEIKSEFNNTYKVWDNSQPVNIPPSQYLETEIISRYNPKNNSAIINFLPDRNLMYFENKFPESNDSYLNFLKKRIHKNENSSNDLSQHIITGMGGIGKTQLALALAYDSLSSFDVVGWINCGGGNQGRDDQLICKIEQPTSLFESISQTQNFKSKLNFSQVGKCTFINSHISLLSKLGIAVNDTETIESISEKLKHVLLSKNLSWLLIYDDAPSPESLSGFMPQSGGHIIITTRDQTSGHLNEVLNLDIFQPDESVKFLLAETKSESIEDNHINALKAAEALGHLPLALSQAASYMNVKKKSFEEYLNDFKNQKLHLLSHYAKINSYPHVVCTAWAINMQELPLLAQNLMIYFSYLDTNNIPISLFKNEKLGLFSENIESSIDSLLQLSMIKRFRGDKISIHPLVQTVTSLQKEGQAIEHILTLLKLLIAENNQGFYLLDLNKQSIERIRSLIPHALKVFKHAEQLNLEENIILGLRIAAFFNREHRYQEAADFLKKLQEITNRKEILKEKFDKAIRNNLINSYINIDDFENLESIATEDLPALSKAVVKHCLFEYEAAEKFYEESFQEFNTKIARNYNDTKSQLNLALAYKNMGELYFAQAKFDKANELLEKSFYIYKAIFKNEQNEDIASILGFLGKTKRWQSNSESIPLFQQSLDIYKDLYPQGNIETLRWMFEYAITLEHFGKREESLKQFKEAIKIAVIIYDIQENLDESNSNSEKYIKEIDKRYIKAFKDQSPTKQVYSDQFYSLMAFLNGDNSKLSLLKFLEGFETLKKLPHNFPVTRSRKRTIDDCHFSE